MGFVRIATAVALVCTVVGSAHASFQDDAKAALSGRQDLTPAQRAIVEAGAQLDKCGDTPDSDDVVKYMQSNGGMGQLVRQVAAIEDALDHCADKTHPRFDAVYAGALRDTIVDMGHHLKFVRGLVAPCVMASPDAEPPTQGAWALNAWLRDARGVLESNGCVVFGTVDAAAAAQQLHARRVSCSCATPVIIAVATSIGSTAMIALMVAFLLSSMPGLREPSSGRHHEGRHTAAGGSGPFMHGDSGASTSVVHTPRARHTSIDTPRGSPGGGFKHVEPGPLLEMGVHHSHLKSPKPAGKEQSYNHHKGSPEP